MEQIEYDVISLFNGMGCAWIAFDRAAIKVKNRISSEIDKYAIIVNNANYPDTIQVGDIRNIYIKNRILYYPGGSVELSENILIVGGSPCQSFSFAGKRKGMATKDNIEILSLEHYLELKEQQFEFEGQSYLFWEYMRILNDIRKYNPDVKFLLENVIMGEKWQKVLTRAIGINPIRINSALLSAQNRDRLYWTNIGAEQDGLFGDLKCTIPQPKDKGILLKDILEAEVDEKYYLSGKMISGLIKHNENSKEKGRGFNFAPSNGQGKGKCIRANNFKMGPDDNYICVASRGLDPENPSNREKGLNTEQRLEPRNDGKTNCLTSVQKDNLVLQIAEATKKGYTTIKPGECFDFENPNSETRRGRKMDKKTNCLMAKETNFMQFTEEGKIRRLTPLECERLQTVPDNYTNHVSDTQRYKMLGNGWTVDVIAYIFSYI